jgi:hypothetical protein
MSALRADFSRDREKSGLEPVRVRLLKDLALADDIGLSIPPARHALGEILNFGRPKEIAPIG